MGENAKKAKNPTKSPPKIVRKKIRKSQTNYGKKRETGKIAGNMRKSRKMYEKNPKNFRKNSKQTKKIRKMRKIRKIGGKM